VANGLSLESNLETLEAEKLKTEQSIVEASETIKGLYKIMSNYLIFEINDSTRFSSQIEPIENPKAAFNRPEIRLFETQKMQLEARHKLNQALALPKLTFNADAAYGRPGPNFLDQNLRVFGTAAINLRWNISSLYTLNNEKKQTDLGKKMIDVQREVFDLNTRNALITQESQINALQNILKTDQEILSKRKNISHTASAQFENGTLNSSDYLTQVNAEMQALLNQKIHEIKLMNSILNYNLIKGKNYFNQSN
jgi:outer membrane protein TolC